MAKKKGIKAVAQNWYEAVGGRYWSPDQGIVQVRRARIYFGSVFIEAVRFPRAAKGYYEKHRSARGEMQFSPWRLTVPVSLRPLVATAVRAFHAEKTELPNGTIGCSSIARLFDDIRMY